ncbi:hypothetical protein TrVE_jg4907 [Triparma verrucosa]|uniref:50S ribosomal protein L35 n=2 Tax=Triparma TaxID=722752 RepID=A0A9W7BC47_9STRA|nr:hypothetical protein TrST_g438 [Triparma strigata]GMH94421.1 hypothetical protein TrVE_jg4907 [Triparma verrucosa]
MFASPTLGGLLTGRANAGVSRAVVFGLQQCRAFATKGKTKKAVSKRFKLMANNRIKRAHAGTGHNTGYRSTKRNNNLAKSTDIKQSKIDKTIRRMLQI